MALGQEATFLRFVDKGDWQGSLQTAVVAYEDSKGREVTLVAAMHIGDPSYYQELQGILDGFDPLLFEGGEGSAGDWSMEPEGVAEGNWLEALFKLGDRGISLLEQTLRLDLGAQASQWDSIDYSRKNFLSADMDLKTFRRLSRERGEAFIWMRIAMAFFPEYLREAQVRLMGASPREIAGLLRSLGKDRRKVLRFLYARELAAAEAPFHRVLASRFEGRTVIIHERNRIAFEALRRQLDSGKSKIGIFYGADHMPDLERRLARDLGFKKKSEGGLPSQEGGGFRRASPGAPGIACFASMPGLPAGQRACPPEGRPPRRAPTLAKRVGGSGGGRKSASSSPA